MIKRISEIAQISFIEHLGSDITLLPLNSISFYEDIFGFGGFGNVHKIESINGIQTQNYLLKLFDKVENQEHAYKTISLLHNKLKKLILKEANLVSNNYPELLGLPFLAFYGYNEIDENQIMGLLMHDLNKQEFEDFGSDNFNKRKYIDLDISDKLYLAYQLSNCLYNLHGINFIHSDLSENAIWINFNTLKLALIDFDSGFHHDIQNKPTTIGKIGQWIGSRYRKILSKEGIKDNLTLEERIQEENWILANSIFELIFGMAPFFFLKDALDETKEKYLKEIEWPNIRKDSLLFNSNNEELYSVIINKIEYFEENGLNEIITAFKKVFNKGYKNEKYRLSAKDWQLILFKICSLINSSPIIKNFKSDKLVVNSDDEFVKFEWEVAKGNFIYIDNILINSYYLKVNFTESRNVTLKVENEFGEATSLIHIEANKIDPEIEIFTSNISKRTDLSLVKLTWETKNSKFIILENNNQKFLPKDSFEVNPLEKTTYIIKAVGNFGQEMAQSITIDVTLTSISFFKYEINIDKGIDNIDLFWETQFATEVYINPRIGNVELSGKTFIGIPEKTEFTLTAKSHFNEVSYTIETKPFPLPIIKGIFIPTPIISLNVVVPENNLKIPENLFKYSDLNLNKNISFDLPFDNFVKLRNEVIISDSSKSIIEKLTKIFDDLFKIITKK